MPSWPATTWSSRSPATRPSWCRCSKPAGLQRTWLVGGGDLAGQLLAADLVDELILTVAPTFVGRGPTLADGEFPLRRFTLTELKRFGEDGVRLRYERRPAAKRGA